MAALFLAGVIALTGLIAACATSHVMIGKARPPIAPASVQIYMQPPATHYEDIAILDTSSSGSFAFTAQGKTDKVIERLKIEAAKLGANGVLLQGIDDRAGGSIGTGFGQDSFSRNSSFGLGIGTSGTLYQKVGSGRAIYVDPKQ